MPEKATSFAWVFRPNQMIHWLFKVLTLVVFLTILIVWSIDGWNFSKFHKDFLVINLNTTQIHRDLSSEDLSHQSNSTFQEHHDNFPKNFTHTHKNFTQTQQISGSGGDPIPLNLSQDQLNFASISPKKVVNLTHPPPTPGNLGWISAEFEAHYSSNLLAKWLAPGGEPCRVSETVNITVPALDGHYQIELSTGDIHEFVFQAVDDQGNPRCLGGDYFETDLSGESWKSRPPVKDLGNGTYTVSLQVHQDFPGIYNLTVILLFRRHQGLKFSPLRFAFDKTLRIVAIKFHKSSFLLPDITQCQKADLTRDVWSGRWTRHAKNDNCSISNDGRYRCLKPNFPCQLPWCNGSLGLLESNGWTYSTHCSFKLFDSETAWKCLNNRWIFWWGDSNHCDTIRNILHFILNVHEIKMVPRRFDMNITNPNNPSEMVRITNIFNGHPNDTGNYQGLNSLIDEDYRNLLKGYFSGEVVPDTVIMNSGLHDGVFWQNLRRFISGAEYAAAFWAEVMEGVRQRGLVAPEIIYRTTVTTGGYARRLAYNPSKMEAFNGVVLDKFRKFGLLSRVIDGFDMTYPWHYDNRCNDGVHYGRAPAKMRWRDGEIGHQYFVDLMLCHVLLNALCAR
ncbi:unnamed protein product [Ilex paraguariensis]|uniref:Uncharacterized protein n=1 Tax=Ilex paraguariensis TaxID=185542 RepID=A0ABC8U0U2_9AQUA